MPDIKPQSTVDVEPNVELLLGAAQEDTGQAGAALPVGGQVRWMRPGRWPGKIFDWTAIHTPFARDTANQQFVKAVQNPQEPGTTGDLIAATVQIDYLAVAERAFRVRHTMTPARMAAHAAGRLQGLGSAQGPFMDVLEYMRRLVQQAKA